MSIAEMTASGSLINRLTACAAEQDKPEPYSQWVMERIWKIAASPGWAAKWDSAIAAEIPDPGSNPTVITDADILAVIQPMQ